MIIFIILLARFIKPGLWSHIDLAADNRPDSRRYSRPVKLNNTVHNTVVRDGHAVHAKLLCPGY